MCSMQAQALSLKLMFVEEKADFSKKSTVLKSTNQVDDAENTQGIKNYGDTFYARWKLTNNNS